MPDFLSITQQISIFKSYVTLPSLVLPKCCNDQAEHFQKSSD